jgi:hypothetical protein
MILVEVQNIRGSWSLRFWSVFRIDSDKMFAYNFYILLINLLHLMDLATYEYIKKCNSSICVL